MATSLGKNEEIIVVMDRYEASISWQPCPGGLCTYIHAQITDLKLEEKIETRPRRGCVLACPPAESDVHRVWNNLVRQAQEQTWGVPASWEAVIREMERKLHNYGI